MEVQEGVVVRGKIRVGGHCKGLALLNWLRSCVTRVGNIPHKQLQCPLRSG